MKKKYNLITNIRKSFINCRNTVIKLDKSLSLPQFGDCIVTITSIMTSIYIACIGRYDPFFGRYTSTLFISTLLLISKMTINCLIHGMVYEESQKLFSVFEELNVSMDSMDENVFREVLYFKSQMSELKFSFTIAGLVAYRKITLLSVSL